MIHDYEEFCKLDDQEKVNPDVSSTFGRRSVASLRDKGWKIRWWRKKKDLLAICRRSEENFQRAHDEGIDFWEVVDL